jgi:hypothetical protein
MRVQRIINIVTPEMKTRITGHKMIVRDKYEKIEFAALLVTQRSQALSIFRVTNAITTIRESASAVSVWLSCLVTISCNNSVFRRECY